MTNDLERGWQLDLLEEMTARCGVEFDECTARAALLREPRGEDPPAESVVMDDLVMAARDLGLRLTPIRTSVRKAVELVLLNSPLVGLGLPRSSAEAGNAQTDGQLAAEEGPEAVPWQLLIDRKGRKVQLAALYDGERERWVSQVTLCGLLRIEHPDAIADWLVATPIAPCALASVTAQSGPLRDSHDAGSQHHERGAVSALRRLFQLLSPEWIDIRVILILAVGVGILSLATPLAVEALVTTVAFNRLYQQLLILSVVLFGCLSFAAGLRAIQTYVVEIIQQRLFVRLVSDLSYRIPRARYESHGNTVHPELVNRFLEIVTVQKVVAQMLLDGIALVLSTLVSLVVLAFYHPFLLGFDVVFLLFMVVFVFLIGKGGVTTSIQESRAKYAVLSWLQDMSRLPVIFMTEGGRDLAMERSDLLARNYLTARKGHFRIYFRQVLFAVFLQALAGGALLGLGGWLVLEGQLTLGQLVAAELMVTTIAGSFAKLGKHIEGYYDVMASMEKLGHLLDLPLEQHGVERQRFSTRNIAIRLVNVGYAFESTHHTLFADLSFALGPRERLAVTGPRGSGKSTLLELLLGLREPTEGHLEWNDVELKDLRQEDIRRLSALVHNVEILPGSIIENLRAGRQGIPLWELRRALEDVGLLDEIQSLADGMHTELDYKGRPLSTSQLARLMLARGIAGRPCLLVVDQLLDGLAVEERRAAMQAIFDPEAPWTLAIASNHPEIINACEQRLWLGDPMLANAPSRFLKIEVESGQHLSKVLPHEPSNSPPPVSHE